MTGYCDKECRDNSTCSGACKDDEVSSSNSNALLCDASIDGRHEENVDICGYCGKLAKHSNEDRDSLLKKLDEYIEFAEGCRNFSNLAFYKELKLYIENT